MYYMSAMPLSIRLPERTLGRLADRSGRSGLAPRTLAQRYVEEGLRMDDHPLVRFAEGPSGRRARLIGGPDVWEVIAVARDNDGDLRETASYLELALREGCTLATLDGKLRAAAEALGVPVFSGNE